MNGNINVDFVLNILYGEIIRKEKGTGFCSYRNIGMNKRIIHLRMIEIRKALESKQYSKALKVVNTMNWNKIKEVNYLNLVIEVLEKNAMYEHAKEILLKLYDNKISKRSLASLVRISIGLREFEDATKYLEEYKDKTHNDIDYNIIKYMLHKAQKKNLDILIDDLEELKSLEYIEKWGYELAKIYHKAGNGDDCVRECDRIILWFGEGLYADKARLLKEYYNYGAQIEEFIWMKPNNQNEEDEITFIKEQILFLFEEISEKGYVLPIFITGQNDLGKRELIKKLLTALFKLGYIKSSQIGKIKAERLNDGFSNGKIIEFLKKGLIIENASDLSRGMLEELMDVMIVMIEKKENFVLIIDYQKDNVEDLIGQDPKYQNLKYHTIHTPEYR